MAGLAGQAATSSTGAPYEDICMSSFIVRLFGGFAEHALYFLKKLPKAPLRYIGPITPASIGRAGVPCTRRLR